MNICRILAILTNCPEKMKHTFFLITALFILLNGNCQDQQWKGYWESGFWKKCLKQQADSSGKHVHHYGNGKIMHEGAFEKGIPVGVWTHYDPSGNKTAEAEFSGPYSYWHKGCLSRTGDYLQGKRTGIWIEYYYRDYSKCDSVLYHCEYDFEKQTEQWNNYDFPGSVEKYYVDPGHFNRDLNYNPHRFTEVQAGIQLMNFNLLNRSLFKEEAGFSGMQRYVGIAQTFLLPSLTSNEIRMEYHHFLPEEIPSPDTGSIRLSNYRLTAAMGTDLIRNERLDVYPVFGIGLGMMQIDREGLVQGRYYKPAFLLSFMLEERLNIRPAHWKKGISIGTKAGYIADMAATDWTRKAPELPFVSRARMSGVILSAILAISL